MNRLRELREAQSGLSKEQLAVEFGVSKETIDRWERGYYDIPTRHARALAKRFSVSLSWLMCDDEHKTVAPSRRVLERLQGDSRAARRAIQEAKEDEAA